MEITQSGWRPLGELIVERGLITQEQLEDALLEQRITHKRLGTILIDSGVVTAQQLTDALVDQIGVEELLDELEPESNGDDAGPSHSVGDPIRRLRDKLHVDIQPSKRLARPFGRRGRSSSLGRRRDAPVAPFAPVPYPEIEPEPVEEPVEAAAVVELVERTVIVPGPEAAGPEPEPEIEQQQEAIEPQSWLATAREALEHAEVEHTRLDNAVVARTIELSEARKELTQREVDLTRAEAAHRQAEDEIKRLHGLIDERDSGLTAMETTIEELRSVGVATQTDLDNARAELQGATAEAAAARRDVSAQKARVAELEATLAVHERHGARVEELEAQVAELAENLSATDETLGIEMHAREQAQRDAKRMREELVERDARVAKLARQVEVLEKELEVVVAEREQAQRKLRSRERRVMKLETDLAELRAEPEEPGGPATAEAVVAEPQTEPEAEPEAQPEPEPVPTETAPEPVAEEKPKAAPAKKQRAKAKQAAPASDPKQSEGFLYFVPRAGEGYALVEQPGDAPAVGDTVEFEDASFEVTRHSRSPLPFDRRVCVYLRTAR